LQLYWGTKHQPLAMSTHHQEEKNKFQLERIALFSDAVFAISITLLVIEIKVPVIPSGTENFSEEFNHAILHMVPEFLGFFISFIVIGQYWKAHHTIFGYLKDYDRKLISLNTWFLLSIVCMPFTTGLVSRFMQFLPYMYYVINVIVTGLIQVLLWRYVVKHKEFQSEPIPQGIIKFKYASAWVVVIFFLLSLPVSLLFGGAIGRMFLVTVFIFTILNRRYYDRKYKIGEKV